jgi:PAS domain S-box-containing protein
MYDNEPAAFTPYLDHLFKLLPDCFIWVDRKSYIRYVNQAFENLTRLPKEEVLGRKIQTVFPANEYPQAAARLRQAVRYKTSMHFEKLHPSSGKWLEINAFPSENGLLIYFKDITGLKRVEADNHLLKQKLEAMLVSTQETHLLINRDFRVLSFNEKAAENFRFLLNRQIQIGDSIQDFLLPGTEAEVEMDLKDAFNGTMITVEREMAFSPGQSVWFSMEFRPIRDEYGEVSAVSFNTFNIDRHKQQEKILTAQQHILLEIIRFQSHDFRRPVSTILGLISLFDPDHPDPDWNRELMHHLTTVATELDTMIHELVKKASLST